MTFLPIVARELRLAARRRSTYWLRSAAALTIMLIGVWLFLLLKGEPPKQLAMALFCVLTGGAVLFALLSGPRSTADAISEEKREGTLGLLFLTDLKGYDVVLGKLVAGSLNAFYSIVAVVPMTAIPLLLGGGLTLAEFGRMSLVMLDALGFSLALGICVSVMSRSAHKSAAVTSFLILFFSGLLPALGALIASFTRGASVNWLFLAPSVGFSYYLAFDGPYRASTAWYWASLATVHLGSWLCLAIASLWAPRAWQDRPPGAKALSWRERWQVWTFGDRAERVAFRRRLLEINPVLWLTARVRSKTASLWLFVGLATCAWLGCWWKFKRDWLNEGVYLTTAVLLNLLLRYWLAGEATRALAEQRKSGALELLLSTPLSIPDILRGHALALWRQFFGPVLAALATETLFMLATVHEAVPDEERLFWFALWTAGMVMLVLDLAALYWLGLWQGLTAKNPLRALGASLFRILVVPWIGYGFVLLLIILRDMQGGGGYGPGPTWKFFLGLWFGLGVAVDVAFLAWARQKLLTEFRLAAQEQFRVKSKFWDLGFGSFKAPVTAISRGNLDLGT